MVDHLEAAGILRRADGEVRVAAASLLAAGRRNANRAVGSGGVDVGRDVVEGRSNGTKLGHGDACSGFVSEQGGWVPKKLRMLTLVHIKELGAAEEATRRAGSADAGNKSHGGENDSGELGHFDDGKLVRGAEVVVVSGRT